MGCERGDGSLKGGGRCNWEVPPENVPSLNVVFEER
jgi:hypothetical protein